MKEFAKKLLTKLLNKETILYTVFGVVTSLLNIFLFRFLLFFEIDYKIANIITLVVVKLVAYLCNKWFVFKSHCKNFGGLVREFLRFLVARGATALIDYFGLIILVEVINLEKVPCKIFVTILVIVINYVVGKLAVFKDAKKTDDSND